MAELADAIDLGSIGNTVQVQVLSPAPYWCNEIDTDETAGWSFSDETYTATLDWKEK